MRRTGLKVTGRPGTQPASLNTRFLHSSYYSGSRPTALSLDRCSAARSLALCHSRWVTLSPTLFVGPPSLSLYITCPPAPAFRKHSPLVPVGVLVESPHTARSCPSSPPSNLSCPLEITFSRFHSFSSFFLASHPYPFRFLLRQ